MTLLEEFSKDLEGKDINKLIHEAKAESESRILGQKVELPPVLQELLS